MVVSLYDRITRENYRKTAEKIFIPMTVGGVKRILKDIHRIQDLELIKFPNTAAIKSRVY